ncbi:MAG: pentapeptide repeat-containing protein [Candidatus Thiodiazotropha sp. (ex Lucinoma kastoroae)]|nr:pentapeptide repeat-containing protein [Candidatus Thiodiazotropha sp. (ex Lucinoma kastoroae)]
MPEKDEKRPQTWFVRHDGLITGPLSGARIRHLLLGGELELGDEISFDKQQWQRIREIPSVVPLQLRAEAGDSKALAQVAAREKAQIRDSEQERRFPMIPLVISVLIISVVMFYSLWFGMPNGEDEPQCNAPPAAGVNWRNCLILNLDVGAASLAGADLNSAVLRNAKLSAANLSNADLRYANLSQSDLRYADLSGALMVGVNLQLADLRDADLSQTDLRFADLSNSRLDGIILRGAHLDNAIWIDGRICGINSIGNCQHEAEPLNNQR